MPAPGGGSSPKLPKKKQDETADVESALDVEAQVVPNLSDDDVTDALPLTSSVRAASFQESRKPRESALYSFLPDEDRAALGGPPVPQELAALNNQPVQFKGKVAQGPTPSDPYALSVERQKNAQPVIDPETGELVGYAPSPQYQPVPTDPEIKQRAAFRLMQKLTSEGISPFDTAKITNNLRTLVNTPIAAHLVAPDIESLLPSDAELMQEIGVDVEGLASQDSKDRSAAAWILDNMDFVQAWQSSYYNHVVAAPLQRMEGTEDLPGADDDTVSLMAAELFKENDQTLDSDLRNFIINVGAVLPDYREIAKEKGVTVYEPQDMNWWSVSGQVAALSGWIYSAVGLLGGKVIDPREAAADFATGSSLLSNAGETRDAFVQDPYAQILSEMNLWLQENPPTTVEEKGKFVEHFSMRAFSVVDAFVANSSGLDSVLNAYVANPFRLTANAVNEWMFTSADPDSFISKENLSWGQNVANLAGMDPSDKYWMVASGSIDALLNLTPVDEINVIAGIGNGMRLANQVPRIVSKGETIRDAFRFGRMRAFTELPVWNHGPISRFTYALFSKTHDDIIKGRGFQRLARQLSNITSESEIINRVPSWARSDRLVWHLANTADTPEKVTELVRASIYAPELLGTDAPLLMNATADGLRTAVDKRMTTVQSWLDEGNSLAGVGAHDQVIFAAEPQQLVTPRAPEGAEILDMDVGIQVDTLRRSQKFIDNIDDFEDVSREAFKLRDGREGELVYGVTDLNERYTIALVDGEIAGGRIGNMAGTADKFQEQGIYTTILRHQRDKMGLTVQEVLAGGDPISEAAARTLNRVFTEDKSVFKLSQLNQSGGDKIVATAYGGAPSVAKIDPTDLANHLYQAGLMEDAAIVAQGGSLSVLSDRAQQVVTDYVQYAQVSKFGVLGDEVVVTPAGRSSVLRGKDTELPFGPGGTTYDDLGESFTELTRAKIGYDDLRTKMNPDRWFIGDVTEPMNQWTKNLRRSLSNNSTKAWAREARRRGHTMTHAHPGNIDMTQTLEGGRMLRNWMKFLGANDELANKWEDAFRAGNVGTRKQIIMEALSETGEQIGDPLLREGLIQFSEKQAYEAYSYGRGSVNLGQLSDGRVRPVTLTHLQNTFAMPDYRTVAESVRRYRTGKRLPNFLTRGFVDAVIPDFIYKKLPSSVRSALGTRATRDALKRRLAAQLKRKGVQVGKNGLTEDDLLAMAYADVMGGAYGRAAGHGVMSKAFRVVGNAYRGFHNVFTVAQLAGRPISWTSRVLIEENMRASMFGMPSLFSNPYDWGRQMFESQGIRQLPELLQQQARIADEIVDGVFRNSGDALRAEMNQVIPGFTDMLDEANISLSNTQAVRNFFADVVSNDLTGVVEETTGARSNVAWRVARRRDKIARTYKNMARDGFNNEWRFDIEGADIAQRSIYQSFLTEAEAAAHPMEWSLGNMSKGMQQKFGHGYGRQAFQMYHDPVVGTYGRRRWLAKVSGEETRWTAEKLADSRDWARIRHIVDELLIDKQVVGLDEVGKAEWYLTNIVDEINATLYGPLMRQYGDQRAFLRALDSGVVEVEINGTKRTLDFASGNYQGLVDEFEELAQDAYAAGVQLPTKIAAYFDPRYGQKGVKSVSAHARAATDWVMERAGERPTQYLHRQPTFKHIHGKWYRYLRNMGWDEKSAEIMATQKSAQLTNFIFFDNKNIPGFLKSANQYIPFFSAMWEVSSTWFYKIPSVDTLPAGYLHMARRVDRIFDGLMATGLLRQDPETGDMRMTFTDEGEFGVDPVSTNISKGLAKLFAFPGRIMENLMFWEDQTEWDKDGFSIAIGNPLDPTSTGLMAVNQFSAGPDPSLAWPAGLAVEAAFKLNDKSYDTEGMTAAEFIAQNPDIDFEDVYRYNQEAFNNANPQELIARVLDQDFPMEQMKMPKNVVLPSTSLWETMVDRVFFPYGKLHGAGEVAYSVVPSSLAHVVRGGLLKVGWEDDDIAEFFIGSTSQVAIAGEVLNQLQIEEFKHGTFSSIMQLIDAADKMLDEAGLRARTNEDGSRTVLNPEDNESVANAVQRMWSQIEDRTESAIIRANNNAAGSMLVRGITGWLSPSTPRMWDRQQEQIATYWSARDIAEQARETGRIDYSNVANVTGIQDMVRARDLIASFLDDPSGRDAKVWMRQNYPGMDMYLQGKTYWAGSGMPAYAKAFDEWIDQVESGDRDVFPEEVFLMRFWRSGIALDREVAIREAFGSEPLAAAYAILNDPEAYYSVTDDYGARIESLEFIDQHLFDGKYASWRAKDLGELSTLEVLLEEQYMAQDSVRDIEAALDRSGLDPRQRRTMLGQLNAALAEEQRILDEIRELQGDPAAYRTKRDMLLDQYREEVTQPYYNQVREITDRLDGAYSRADEQLVWEDLRTLEDDAYFKNYYITDEDSGMSLEVPPPMVRTWNGKSQGERQQRLLYMVEGNPEWLSQFDISVLADTTPAAQVYLPLQPEVRGVYDENTRRKHARIQEWTKIRDVTKSQLDAELREMDDEVDKWLKDNGYGLQVEYKEATPFERLDMLRMLPRSLSAAVPVYRQVLAELDAIEKSELSNAGSDAMGKFTRWLESEYFAKNHTALEDLQSIGFAMFGTKTPTVLYRRLFQGSEFGELLPYGEEE